MNNVVIRYFNYFYSRVSGNSNYAFIPKNSEVSMIKNFLDLIPKNAGDQFLYNYFCYQFYYWHDKDTQFGKGKIQLNWVIGKKAYERYVAKKDDHWRSYSTTLFEKFNIRRSELIVVNSEWMGNDMAYEESDKMLYHNTDKGLLFCLDYTSMYHPKSEACGSCKNVSFCMNLMKGRYPTVYKKRMEAAA